MARIGIACLTGRIKAVSGFGGNVSAFLLAHLDWQKKFHLWIFLLPEVPLKTQEFEFFLDFRRRSKMRLLISDWPDQIGIYRQILHKWIGHNWNRFRSKIECNINTNEY